MTSKSQIIKMSFLPLIIIIALILGAGYLLINGEIKLPKFNKGPQIRRLEGFPTIIYTDKVLDKQRQVIKSDQELNQFLNTVDSTGLLVLKEKINFDKEYLIGVSTKTYDETGHKMKIRKVYEDKNKKTLLVSIIESESEKNCPVEQQTNIPVDLVAISKTDSDIAFERIKDFTLCSTNSDESTDSNTNTTNLPNAKP